MTIDWGEAGFETYGGVDPSDDATIAKVPCCRNSCFMWEGGGGGGVAAPSTAIKRLVSGFRLSSAC